MIVSGRRRDLLFTLAGAIIASSVLIPVSWLYLRAERQRAESAREALEHKLAEQEAELAQRRAAEAAEVARLLALTARLEAEFKQSETESNAAIEAFNDAAGPRP